MKLPFFLLVLLLSINFATADINIIVQSENNKTLSVVDLKTFTTVAQGQNNQTFANLDYDTNYEIRLIADTDLTVSETVSFFEGAWNKLVYFALIVLIVFFIYYIIKGLSS